MQIPLIDCDQEKRSAKAIAADIDHALSTCGFMSVTGLGLSASDTARVLATARTFFTQEQHLKDACAYRSADENFGYQAVGIESLDPSQPADLKETFTMRNLLSADIEANRWPGEDFRSTIGDFYRDAFGAAQSLQRLMALALGLAEDFFVACHSGENVTLRLLHYPPVEPGAVLDQQMGAGAHTDYGLLTLLLQDEVGGLQVRDEEGAWHDVPPRRDAIVVNAGDLLERWSNGRYRSTWHRVLPRATGQDRYSVALFVDPDSATEVTVLPSCVDAANPARYPPTTAGAHLTSKILATHRS